MEEWEAFLKRLGGIHQAVHVHGRTVLNAILKTSVEMLECRNCTSISVVDDPMREIMAGRPVVKSDTTLVYVHTEDKVGVKFARTIVDQSEGKCCILVSIDGPTSFTKNEFNAKNIQFMLCKFLFVNILHHKLVPCHSLLSDDHGMDTASLPIILDSDPIVQFYNWPVGGVVKIERVFAGNEPTVYYRRIQASN